MDNNLNKVCASCGKALDENQKFCSECGAMYEEIPVPQAVAENIETAPVEAAPVEAAPVEAAPVEAPVEAAPVEAPVEAPVAAPVAAPVEAPVAAPVANKCNMCGNDMAPGQVFCARCGNKKEVVAPVAPAFAGNQFPNNAAQPVNPAYMNYNPQAAVPAAKPKSKAPLFIIIGVVAVVLGLIIIGIIGSDSSDSKREEKDKGPDLVAIYNEYCESSWADIGSDESYLSIDTNPYDYDDEGMYYVEGFYAVEKINQELGLPEYVWEEMGDTSGLDGRLSETFEDIGITVSWSYHPDEGFEVTYKKIK